MRVVSLRFVVFSAFFTIVAICLDKGYKCMAIKMQKPPVNQCKNYYNGKSNCPKSPVHENQRHVNVNHNVPKRTLLGNVNKAFSVFKKNRPMPDRRRHGADSSMEELRQIQVEGNETAVAPAKNKSSIKKKMLQGAGALAIPLAMAIIKPIAKIAIKNSIQSELVLNTTAPNVTDVSNSSSVGENGTPQELVAVTLNEQKPEAVSESAENTTLAEAESQIQVTEEPETAEATTRNETTKIIVEGRVGSENETSKFTYT